MASSSRQSGLEVRSESTFFDPLLSSWMTREPVRRESYSIWEDDESRKKERDSETEIKELFRIFDKNHDNTISSSELGKMLTCMGMEVSEEEVETLMKELDKNGNGKIEYREFKAFMQDEMRRSEENPEEQEKAIRMAFKVFDQNGDGVIDAAELKTAMKNLGEPLSDKELNDMMKQADIDKDGKINYEEFIRVWSKSMK
ncbi:neo-calmodulin-like isoform X1 [Biomphalaria glabrata]|uniref:Neo-calmodulin-like isoform X1 n=2 Tax=Biomphalaria TaxID=6525 RepID=A0A9W2Z8W4_BIOGL|nr:neo-calmodulin-like isoform X1 [Biomphalaria glabrata]XP_055871349.1 neo-calmodulin-like isoform X1 [Biomphalaria glabrata]XP_055871350.1 neo-calmodulin-like isoform X1 [Biomphalaria glabrata]XP_055871351.1 neo-calmodulin-like isoform X1 [Biomphalaria glabrata]XP_055871352.1 neo-calmodulin-like isoform X1 [Biomphalaria glabrata]